MADSATTPPKAPSRESSIESTSGVLRSMAFGMNVVLLVLLIAIASYATMELAARISAKAFVSMRMQELHIDLGELAQFTAPETEQADIRSDVGQSDLRSLKVRESQLKTLTESLATLEFAGASGDEKTVYSLQSWYENLSTSAQQLETALQLAGHNNEQLIKKTRLENLLDSHITVTSRLEQIPFDMLFVENPPRNRVEGARAELLQVKSVYEIGSTLPGAPPTDALNKIFDDLVFLFASPSSDQNSAEVMGLQAIEAGTLLANLESELTVFERLMRREIDSVNVELEGSETSLGQLSKADGPVRSEGDPEVKPHWAKWVGPVYSLSYLPSDILLAIVVISTGAIGSLFVGLRVGAPSPALRAPVGAVAGFIAFLIIKGGKFLFLVQTSTELTPMNPYACAFVGIMSGLFTERAYKLLETLFDQASNNITRQSRLGKVGPGSDNKSAGEKT